MEDFVDIDNIGTLSFNPGMEIEYPISERWRLRAYGHAGWGIETETSDSAWIFDAGVKSRFAFQNGNLDWAVVNEVFFATYDEKQGKLKWDISYRWFQNTPLFSKINAPSDEVKDEWEIGLAIAKRHGPIKIWFLNFEHMGLSYRFDSSGNFEAITVNFRSPFTR